MSGHLDLSFKPSTSAFTLSFSSKIGSRYAKFGHSATRTEDAEIAAASELWAGRKAAAPLPAMEKRKLRRLLEGEG